MPLVSPSPRPENRTKHEIIASIDIILVRNHNTRISKCKGRLSSEVVIIKAIDVTKYAVKQLVIANDGYNRQWWHWNFGRLIHSDLGDPKNGIGVNHGVEGFNTIIPI